MAYCIESFPPQIGDRSPWGVIDHVEWLGPDARGVTTPSHGGIAISESSYNTLPESARSTRFSGGGWYEEDCDWAIPYIAFRLGQFDHDDQTPLARKILDRYFPNLAAALAVEIVGA